MLKNVAAFAALIAFSQAVQLTTRFDHVAENESVDSCWESECAKRAIEMPTPEEKIEEIEEAVESVEEEIEEEIEEILDPEPEPESEEDVESELSEEEEEEEEEEEPIIVLPPTEPVPEVFVEAEREAEVIETIVEKTEELVEDFCGLPWDKPLAPEVAEKALADAIETVENYEMADEDQLAMLEGEE